MTAAQCGAEIEDIQLCTCGQSASHPFCDKSHLLVNASTGRQFSPVALAALQKHAAETKTDGLSTHDLLVVHAAARRCASGRRPKLNDALEHNRAVLSAARRRDVDEVLVKSANKENNDVAAVAADLCQDPLCDRQSSTSSTNSGVAAVVADVTEVDDSSSPSVPTRHRPRRHHRRQRHEQPTAASSSTAQVVTSDIEDTVEDPQAVLQRSANDEHQVTPVFSWRRMRKRDLLAVTPSELAQHTTRDSCWVAVGSNVYDVTDYLDQHKSGAGTILKHAGTDITHHVQFHSSAMMKLLKKHYLIGTLVAESKDDDQKQQTCSIV